ncbi:MAG: hypothetical protein HY975_00260 [Candidatus Kerfeldbacteria bacterium]|nr:hypothetical protein [Candidatus Kerfeldbacteria bacterium]
MADGLEREQYEALCDLALLDLEVTDRETYFPDPYDDDRCTLDAHEEALIKRCTDTGVPFHLVDRFARRYAYNTILPRPELA